MPFERPEAIQSGWAASRALRIAVIVGTLLCWALLLYGISEVILRHSYKDLEDKEVRRSVEQVQGTLARELDTLSTSNRDYAWWDDTYQFAKDGNLGYLNKDLNGTSMSGLKINFLAFINPSGKIIYATGYDVTQSKNVPYPSNLRPYFAPSSPLLAFKTISDSNHGVACLPEGNLLLAANCILDNDGKGPSRGWILMGRWIDAKKVGQWSEQTRRTLSLTKPGSPQLPPEIRSTLRRRSGPSTIADDDIRIRTNGEDTVSGFSRVPDLKGGPGLILRVDVGRELYRSGQATVHLFLGFLMCSAAVFSLILVGLAEKLFRSQLEQREFQQRYLTVTEKSPEGLVLFDPDTLTVLEANSTLADILGVPRSEIVGSPVGSVLPYSPEQIRQFVDDLHRQKTCLLGESLLRTPQGWDVYIDAVAHMTPYQGRERVFVTLLDVSDRKRSEAALRQSEERFRALVRNASDVIAIVDRDGTFHYASPACETVWGVPAERLNGTPFYRLLHPQDLIKTQLEFGRLLEDKRTYSGDMRFRHADGSYRSCEVKLNNRLDEPGVEGVVLTCRDVTERLAFEEQLSHQAFHDALTALPNRILFVDRVEHALQRSSRTQKPIAVLFLDLDGFKVVNDSLGHDAGDQLLVRTGERLLECIRANDTVARLGGDEFTVLLEDLDDLAYVEEIATRIRTRLAEPFLIQDHELYLTTSIGIALNGLTDLTAEELLRDADTAMYWAKGTGKARHVVFDPKMNTLALERLELTTDMRRGLENHEFRVYYQPIVHLETQQIKEVEALVRWEHPERGLIPPVTFIPLAEETGLIVQLGLWVMEEACAAVKRWQNEYPGAADMVLSVNLSGRQFQQTNLVQEVIDVLDRTGFSPHNLKLEITESVMLSDMDASIDKLHQLKAIGVRLAIDDFGTGYSSMSYLSTLPIDTIKIDRSFIKNIGMTSEDEAIIQTMVSLAYTLQLQVTSEGIETQEQHRYLNGIGCGQGQGYLFARPLTEGDMTDRMESLMVSRSLPESVPL